MRTALTKLSPSRRPATAIHALHILCAVARAHAISILWKSRVVSVCVCVCVCTYSTIWCPQSFVSHHIMKTEDRGVRYMTYNNRDDDNRVSSLIAVEQRSRTHAQHNTFITYIVRVPGLGRHQPDYGRGICCGRAHAMNNIPWTLCLFRAYFWIKLFVFRFSLINQQTLHAGIRSAADVKHNAR